jgi:hypothetical protein
VTLLEEDTDQLEETFRKIHDALVEYLEVVPENA